MLHLLSISAYSWIAGQIEELFPNAFDFVQIIHITIHTNAGLHSCNSEEGAILIKIPKNAKRIIAFLYWPINPIIQIHIEVSCNIRAFISQICLHCNLVCTAQILIINMYMFRLLQTLPVCTLRNCSSCPSTCRWDTYTNRPANESVIYY